MLNLSIVYTYLAKLTACLSSRDSKIVVDRIKTISDNFIFAGIWGTNILRCGTSYKMKDHDKIIYTTIFKIGIYNRQNLENRYNGETSRSIRRVQDRVA